MYVLCRSNGGFNDFLAQCNKCFHYCKDRNRVLLIDSKYSRLNINFSDYFYFKQNSVTIIYDSNLISEIVSNKKLSVFPTELKDRLLSYEGEPIEKNEKCSYIDKESRIKLTYDFSKKYSEDKT